MATSSGTAALMVGMTALIHHEGINVKHSTKVITTPITYIATSNALVTTGFDPVCVDVDPETFLITRRASSGTFSIVANTSALREWIDNENCFRIDYPIIIDQLASLINEVIGRKVGEVKIWDWDEVVKQLETVYRA